MVVRVDHRYAERGVSEEQGLDRYDEERIAVSSAPKKNNPNIDRLVNVG